MGGLVSRYYLESGRFLDRPAFRCIRRLIMLATPHRGAAISLPLVLGEERCLFLAPCRRCNPAGIRGFRRAISFCRRRASRFYGTPMRAVRMGRLTFSILEMA